MKKQLSLVAALVLASSTPTALRAADEHKDERVVAQAQAGDTHKGHGVVNSVNASGGRVNLTHDAIESLKWPKMKMNFKVQDPKMLEGLRAGTEVDFDLRRTGEEYVVTKITPAK